MANTTENTAGKIAMRPCGDYDSTATYKRLDLVAYDDATWCCKKTSVGNTPSKTSEYWMLMVSAPGMEDVVLKTDIASADDLGIVKVDGTTITIDNDGTLHGSASVDVATTEKMGISKPDGTTITIQNGVLSATAQMPSDMTGATASAAGTHGLVPAPPKGAQNKYLAGDGTFKEINVDVGTTADIDMIIDGTWTDS